MIYTELPSYKEMITLNPHVDAWDPPYLWCHLDQTDENDNPVDPMTWAYNMEGLAYIKSNNQAIISENQEKNADITNLMAYFESYMV